MSYSSIMDNTDTTDNIDIHEDLKQKPSSPLDEFKDFLAELWDMIKTDFSNSWQFISSNRSFFTTAAILAILLQVSSVSSLGASFEKYCGKGGGRGNGIMQSGGGNDPALINFQQVQAAKAKDAADTKAANKQAEKDKALKEKIDKKVAKKSKALAEKMMAENRKKGPSENGSRKSDEQYQAEAEYEIRKKATEKAKGKEDAAALAQGKSAAKDLYKAKRDEIKDSEAEMKANKERLSFFEGIKKKFHSTMSPGALGGPLFGRLDLIFDSVKDVFYIVAVLLTIAGILSLPVLVFLIITYYVFKTMISKFIIL